VGLLKPGLKFSIDVTGGSDADEVCMPMRLVRLVLDHPGTADWSTQREVRDEVILARCQARKAYSGHANETRFLWKNLDVAKRPKHPDEPSGEFHNVGIGAREERFQRKTSAGVPEVSGNQPGSASGALPHGGATFGSLS
jgi:hypothetical protein